MIDISRLFYALQFECLQDIAERSGVSYSCLWNLREGKTKLPQHRTLKKILPVLRLKMEIKDA